ncbi:wax ester/triacylglycerol synthase family O-acyltransferase [Nocardia sp. NPDC004068]|uniref:wax ester/triacylglycerol synthase family O-acyltransferase n=1 Tax=Nocardia sp. NPDC004068 TaxID=3364303 RepID=UPI0036886A20
MVLPTEALFLLADWIGQPAHVAALQVFEKPRGAGEGFVGELYEKMVCDTGSDPLFRKHPASVFGVGQFFWTRDEDIDLRRHVHRTVVAEPGGRAQLMDTVSRLHTRRLDRGRPLWEVHLLDGCADVFGVYFKIHHSLVDGVSGQRLAHRVLSENPASRRVHGLWRPLENELGGGGSTVRETFRALAAGVNTRAAPIRLARAVFREPISLAFAAPSSVLNKPVSEGRRCAVRSWPAARIDRVRRLRGASMNDVILAMASGALRAYLAERDALPRRSLIAAVPISLRAKGDRGERGGNKVGATLCTLATDVPDPERRLETIRASMARSKDVYRSLTSAQALALTATLFAPVGFALVPGVGRMVSPPFNVMVSSVPTDRRRLYLDGARLIATYPISQVFDGQTLNLSVFVNSDNLDFGLVGCARSVPHMHRILDHLEHALRELETSRS